MAAPSPAASEAAASRWTLPLVVLALCLACLGVLYRDTISAMVGIWSRSETFAHCYLVAPISLWLVWRRRAHVALLQPRPQPWFALPMLVVAGAWLVADLASVNAATQFGVVTLLVLTVPAVLGWAVARELAFPLAFLFFMVPIGEFMLDPMMRWTADFTVYALRVSGIPVYREGLQFVIPTGTWSVVEACSGVRYLIASFMVGSLFAHLNYTGTRKRLVFCAVALAVPILANWLRAYFIVLLGHLSGNELAVGVDHLVYGWVFFGVVVAIMFFVGARWADPEQAAPVRPASSPVPAVPFHAGLVVPLVLLAIALPHGVRLWVADTPSGSSPAALTAPDLGLPLLADRTIPLAPAFANPDATVSAVYGQAGSQIGVHLAYYTSQRYAAKLVSSENVLVASGSHAWQVLKVGLYVPGGAAPAWRRTELLAGSVSAAATDRQRVEVRQLYWIDGQFTASNVRAKLHAVRGRLMGRGDAGAMITVFAGGTPEQTQAQLDAFSQKHLGAIAAHLQAYRDAR